MIPRPNILGKIDISELKEIVNANQQYLLDKYRLIPEYRREKSINNDYKGRQLLELIQNADDAGSKFAKIIIDTEKHKLLIINEGEPFTIAGFRSIMIPNLSPKRKKKYIGDKGLGFRSILNWSKKVIIDSAGCITTFSIEHSRNKFYELYPDEETRKSILKEFEYKDDVIPFPIFSLPEVQLSETKENITTIEIDFYPEVKDEIVSQLGNLRKEVLLFLNHIESIQISIDSVLQQFESKRIDKTVFIDDKKWTIYDNKVNGEDPKLPETLNNSEDSEDESYSLKIAIQKDLSDNVNKLFTFFPTKIGLQFPMVIHGTFELDSSRNRVIDSAKNRFLISELINLIFKVSDSFFGENATWDKLRLLNYKGNKDTVLEEFGFYKAIDNKLKSLQIFPCIDGKYRTYSEIKYQSDPFSEFIVELGKENHFPELVQKIPNDLNSYLISNFPYLYSEKRYSSQTFKNKVEELSKDLHKSISVNLYAKWISILSYQFTQKAHPISVLYNKLGDLIESNKTIFTPASKNAFINVPEHVKIDYLNSDLAEELYKQFYIQSESDRARKLKDKLDNFINIQSFEPAPVLTKIVSSTNQIIESIDNSVEKQKIVKEMLKSLFDYFNLSNRATESQIRTQNIPVINALNEIKYAKDCFLSNSYPTGRLRSQILGELYENKDLIASSEVLGLEIENDLEPFLVDFLGVNKYFIYEKIENQITYNNDYTEFVFKHNYKPDRFRSAKLTYTRIKNIEILERIVKEDLISREKFIAWIYADSFAREKIHSTSDTEFRYDSSGQPHNKHYYFLSNIPSYVKYQLTKVTKFQEYVINDSDIPILNDFQINYKDEIFQILGINSTVVKEILIQLGAKNDYSDLSIERVENILTSLSEKDRNGSYARRIYQLSIDRFKEKKEYMKKINDLLLHATKDKVKGYYPYNEVYYSNTIGLPKKVLNEKAILNFPKRSGEFSISDFFKVQTFGNIEYYAAEYEDNVSTTIILNTYIKQIRPYILAYRLQKLKSERDIKEAVRLVKSINLILCKELTYNYNGINLFAELYDFAPLQSDKLTYVIKYPMNSDIQTLKKDSQLSDVIAEIYSISFDISNIQDEIRTIYREEIEDTNHKIIETFGEDYLSNAKAKLEITNNEYSFWEYVYQIKNISDKFPKAEDESNFKSLIVKELDLDNSIISQIDYDNLDAYSTIKHVRNLFARLKINIIEFNKISGKNLDYHIYHNEQLNAQIDRIKPSFIISLWNKYSSESIDLQKTFISKINSINSLIATALLDKIKYLIDVEYDQLIRTLIQDNYDIDLQTENENKKYIDKYEKNKLLIGINEEQVNALKLDDRSLLYFELSIEEITRIKSSITLNSGGIDEDLHDSNDGNNDEGKKPKTVTPLAGNRDPNNQNNGKRNKGRKTGRHSGTTSSHQDEVARNRLGKKSEEEVKDLLIEMYGNENVVWLSSYSNHPEKSDNWGFDIKYRVTQDSDWQFVEVKSFYNNSFYLTNYELEVAKKNAENYFLYLVDEDNIFNLVFKELLNDKNELDYNNKYFEVEIKDFKFFKT